MHLGVHWTGFSSSTIAAATITGCWTLALLIAVVAAQILGFGEWAGRLFGLVKVVGGVTLVFAALALVVSLEVRHRPVRPFRPR